jgi:acyl-CoA synthetase (AMP-forming)/AMP-acid ligase II
VAVVEIKPGRKLTVKKVLEYCQELPRYKRPHRVFFDKVPRNPTGKIEKPKLRERYRVEKLCLNSLIEEFDNVKAAY